MTPYEITSLKADYLTEDGDTVTLSRIKLTRDCEWGDAGTYGGWIEKRENLQEDGWITDEAMVYDQGVVKGMACLSGRAKVYGYGIVRDDARVFENVKVYEFGVVEGSVILSGNVQVKGFGVLNRAEQLSGNEIVQFNYTNEQTVIEIPPFEKPNELIDFQNLKFI
jgi:hypothetical protein